MARIHLAVVVEVRPIGDEYVRRLKAERRPVFRIGADCMRRVFDRHEHWPLERIDQAEYERVRVVFVAERVVVGRGVPGDVGVAAEYAATRGLYYSQRVTLVLAHLVEFGRRKAVHARPIDQHKASVLEATQLDQFALLVVCLHNDRVDVRHITWR